VTPCRLTCAKYPVVSSCCGARRRPHRSR
jgi:hypothetical protein